MNLAERESAVFFPTYRRLPPEFVRGEGVFLYDRSGTRFLDLVSGVGVNALGYAHEGLLSAIATQSAQYLHLSNYYVQQPQIDLAERLLYASGMAKVFLCNSGTEAIEGAFKLSRRWGSVSGKNVSLGFSNAFHGRTMAALSLMDKPKYRDGFGPFLNDCRTLPFDDTEALVRGIDEKTCAVFVECVQGEGGVVPASAEFLATLAGLREKFGFLIVADEIQSGIGRTGKFFAFDHYGIKPDVVVVAKALGGGLPLGAILATEKMAPIFQPGTHGSTFGGNPVACAAGVVVLEELRNGLMARVAEMGSLFRRELRLVKDEFPERVNEVRGLGLMIGMELSGAAEPVAASMLDRGVLVNHTNMNVLRFLPPYIITEEHIMHAVGVLRKVLTE